VSRAEDDCDNNVDVDECGGLGDGFEVGGGGFVDGVVLGVVLDWLDNCRVVGDGVVAVCGFGVGTGVG